MRTVRLVLLTSFACLCAFAAGDVRDVPREAMQQRSTLIREAQAEWGLDAPSATFAAQVQQESHWNPDARSAVGARGLGQVMPATAIWLNRTFPRLTAKPAGTPAPALTDPGWSIRALVVYDGWLWTHTKARDDCEHMAKALRGYNGGLGWIYKDEAKAKAQGVNPLINFGVLDLVNSGRPPPAFRENTDYPRLILLRYEQRFIQAGFGPGVCT